MNCEEATLLLCARIDGESTGDDAALDAHLAECEACRRTLSEMELADAGLVRAFSSRQETALALADRVSQAIAHDAKTNRFARAASLRRSLARWTGFAAAAAAGFAVALIFVKPGEPKTPPQRVFTPMQQVAHLTFATGDVFTCPSNQHEWRSISPGDPIDLGAAVRTADAAKCELQLSDGSCMRLNKGTSAQFAGDRIVQVSAGQVWSAVPRNAPPLHVSAGETHVTACGTGSDRGTKFDLSCIANAATVTCQQGSADVAGTGPQTTVHGGQVLQAPSQTGAYACTSLPDPVLTTGWQDELLILKPGDDPEVIARVDQLVSRITMDRRIADAPGATEQHLRARGQEWSAAIAHYLLSARKDHNGDNRRTAARLLADLAPPSCIPDLIGLLTDDEGEVRYAAADALRRVTGQTLGFSPEMCRAARDPAVAVAWQQWWKQNEGSYPRGK